MIYKIIVDKQPMSNPSAEKREYEIDIAQLYFKHDVYDSLVITHDEDYVMRRLALQDYNVLVELDPPIKEPLENVNIELFKGDNYIYLYDMTGNKIVAQYLVKNEFNELYVLHTEMNSAIEQSANKIELYVNGKIADVDGDIRDITAELALKVDKDDNDQVVSMINASADNVKIQANKLSLEGATTINNSFNINENGNVSINVLDSQLETPNLSIGNTQDMTNGFTRVINGGIVFNDEDYFCVLEKNSMAFNEYIGGSSGGLLSRFLFNVEKEGLLEMRLNARTTGGFSPTVIGDAQIVLTDGSNTTTIKQDGITTPVVTQTSKAEEKKNFKKLDNGLDIVKNTDIYKYNMKFENDEDKKHIGFVIGDKFKYREEITSKENDGVDVYSMVAVAYKAIQEQQEQIEELKKRIEKLEKGDK